MKKALKLAATVGMLGIGLLAAGAASAHQWGSWHWNKGGSTVTIYIWDTTSYRNESNAAINDWDSKTLLSLPRSGGHSDISNFDGNYGATGYGGLAEIINYSGSHITHGHSRLNYYYSYDSNGKRGVFCQEVGHLFGLTHSNDGCMGAGYYNNSYSVVQHNADDIYNMYRYHSVTAAAAGQAAAPAPLHAVWYRNPQSAQDALHMSPLAVVGTVTGIAQAADIVVPAKGEPDGVDRVANQTITVAVKDTLKGKAAATIQVFHTGTSDRFADGDPGYAVGQQVVLFLAETRADGRYVLVAPEGRFTVVAGQVHPASEQPFMTQTDGMSLAAFKSMLAAGK